MKAISNFPALVLAAAACASFGAVAGSRAEPIKAADAQVDKASATTVTPHSHVHEKNWGGTAEEGREGQSRGREGGTGASIGAGPASKRQAGEGKGRQRQIPSLPSARRQIIARQRVDNQDRALPTLDLPASVHDLSPDWGS